jgi:cellulose biosynthesis protein BcsQ
MQFQAKHYKDTLVVDVHDLTINLAHALERQNSFKHLVIDLSVFDSVSEDLMKNFTKFGKDNVQKNSFFIVCKQEYLEDYPLVPTLLEAFDMITLEEIERQLLNQ